MFVQSVGIDDEIPGSPSSGAVNGETAALILAGATGAGITIGIITGAQRPNYKTLFENGNFIFVKSYSTK